MALVSAASSPPARPGNLSLYNPKRSAPFSVLIAKDGTILHKRDGYQPGDEIAIEDEVVEALGK